MEMSIHAPDALLSDVALSWKPDAERLTREVVEAEIAGRRDDFTLAEIECSLDLLDAEISALRGRPRIEVDPVREIRELTKMREQLVSLARRLERLPD